jgi:polyvinyl alcohol dehydrogenase (cytochrome)
VIYVGVSSMEEAFAAFKGYACCTFRGSIVALNATTGAMLWQTYMVPDNQGQPGEYSGGSIWGPPAIDVSNNILFAGTGNNYSVPASVEACEKSQASKQCEAATNMFDSFVALNLTTGTLKWSQSAVPYDTANLACGLTPPDTNCPNPHGPDYDFSGGGPNLVNGTVGAGQKSGYYHMLNAATGVPLWSVGIGPGGPLGGILWGTASDGASIFIASANSSKKSVKLISGETITWGFWSALNAKTGKVLWQTPEPTQGTEAISSMSTANGVVYVGSEADAGQMYALDAASGTVLWSYASGGSVLGAPSIVDGVLYWGSGYSRLGGRGNKKLYAFALP